MDRDAVAYARNEDLELCPMCGGRVTVVRTEWDWGPYDLRHVEIRCNSCGGLFVYEWRTDPHRRVPHAIEWWNTRNPAPKKPQTIHGYYLEDLAAAADLLKKYDVNPLELTRLCNNIAKCAVVAERKFTQDMIQHLQERLEKGGKA